MNENQQVVLMIKGVISELPTEQLAKVNNALAEIRALVQTHGDYGVMAVALIGAELAAEE